jgi:hypothetical protein
MSTTTKATLSPKSLAAKDAMTQLKAGHVKVRGQVAPYDKARSAAHSQIEEEIFYRWTSSNSAH